MPSSADSRTDLLRQSSVLRDDLYEVAEKESDMLLYRKQRALLNSYILVIANVLWLAACTATPLGATSEGITLARAKSPPGADVFSRACAPCHGKRGEGLTTAPPIMGTGALPVYPRDDSSSPQFTTTTNSQQQQDSTRFPGQSKRGPFHTAQDLYDYVSERMPPPRGRTETLTREDYWAVVNYVLVAHGVTVPTAGVSASNAKTVDIRR